jgi:tRNA A37 threonylcarbamoyladenosine modification protein TsaB
MIAKLKLFIDTSSNKKTIVKLGDKVLEKNSSVRHSQAVLPMIKKLLNNKSIFQISDISIKTIGESYTGLRVGAAVANALNFALKRSSKIIIPRYD